MTTQTMAMGQADGGALFLRDLWYVAMPAAPIRPGAMEHVLLLGEPLVIGRMRDGALFALRDLCPHRGVPLSAGKLTGDNAVECPYHGWRFRADGVCSLIPSLVEGQDLDPAKIKVRAYPVREQDGLIWVYMAAKAGAEPRNEPPKVDDVTSSNTGSIGQELPSDSVGNAATQQKVRWQEIQTFPCNIDHAVIGLMDPAHGPYVHAHWWWKKTPRMKEKHYAPLPTGFVMTAHRPSKPVYAVLGDVTTEITFELPSTRFETITGRLFGRPFKVVGLTVCTPRDEDHTDIIQVFYFPAWLSFILPFFWIFGRTFIADDRKIVELQRRGLKYNPNLMLIQDSDQPALWYHRVKKAWAESVENGTEFVNPVRERVLRWKS